MRVAPAGSVTEIIASGAISAYCLSDDSIRHTEIIFSSRPSLQWSTKMKQAKEETEEQTRLMAQYGITSETKRTFLFRGNKYDKLADALRYASLGADVKSESTAG